MLNNMYYDEQTTETTEPRQYEPMTTGEKITQIVAFSILILLVLNDAIFKFDYWKFF